MWIRIGLCLAVLRLATACTPKPPPPKLPPKEVPQLTALEDPTGQRSNVVDDAVQVGSNQAKVTYNCGPPHGKNVEGMGLLSTKIAKCEYDSGLKVLTLSDGGNEECLGFSITLSDYRGKGTYNTSALTSLSFGVAKIKQPVCKWDGALCMNWSRDGIHPEAQCTIEINGDGGLQFGTMGATISGTFACSAFVGAFKGCPGVSAVAGCAITRGSFSAAGCVVQKTKTDTPTKSLPPTQGGRPPKKTR